jgi:glucose/arabinose dehydrogenase
MRAVLAVAATLIAFVATPASAREGYRTNGNCDGVPRVALKSPLGICVGLIAEKLGFPRGLALVGSDVYLVDLASRTPGRGRILRLPHLGRGAPEVVLSGLNQPNAIAALPDGTLLVGEVGQIIRFNPKGADPRATVQLVVTGLPQDGRHNLTAFTLASDGALYINIGSRSDNCETANGKPPNSAAPCPEFGSRPPRGTMIRIDPTTSRPVQAANAPVFARGIRNAMGFAFLPDGRLVAASNGRDNIDGADPHLSDDALPHDTLLVLAQGANYGWPYCFDANRPSPEYPRYNCRQMRGPTVLLAPHAAPLSMIRYTGTRLKALTGKLILGYHGYRAMGHRIVALPIGPDGLPHGPEENVVAGWTTLAGVRPQGFPSALLQLPDGSILVAEDQNRTLLRISTP